MASAPNAQDFTPTFVSQTGDVEIELFSRQLTLSSSVEIDDQIIGTEGKRWFGSLTLVGTDDYHPHAPRTGASYTIYESSDLTTAATLSFDWFLHGSISLHYSSGTYSDSIVLPARIAAADANEIERFLKAVDNDGVSFPINQTVQGDVSRWRIRLSIAASVSFPPPVDVDVEGFSRTLMWPGNGTPIPRGFTENDEQLFLQSISLNGATGDISVDIDRAGGDGSGYQLSSDFENGGRIEFRARGVRPLIVRLSGADRSEPHRISGGRDQDGRASVDRFLDALQALEASSSPIAPDEWAVRFVIPADTQRYLR